MSSNWWDEIKGGFTFQKTEDHIFAPYHNNGKRIGDMSRDELIQVIATGYHEREQLAKALVTVCDGVKIHVSGLDHARAIVSRAARKALVWLVADEV